MVLVRTALGDTVLGFTKTGSVIPTI